MVFGAVLTLMLGPLSDRLGPKRFLLGYEVAQIAAALIALVTSQPLWLGLAEIVGSYGRGASGATGPFSPVDQAWLTAELRPAEIARAFRFKHGGGVWHGRRDRLSPCCPARSPHGSSVCLPIADFCTLWCRCRGLLCNAAIPLGPAEPAAGTSRPAPRAM